MKLSQRFYKFVRVLERIGVVLYHLELPSMALLHLIFHLPQLKRKVGDPKLVVELPSFEEGLILKSKKTLCYRVESQGRSKEKVQVIV